MKKKVATHIPGFDPLVHGGFPQGKIVLMNGTPGTGKTIFALQYLYNGAIKDKQKGMFVTFEESRENVRSQAKMFGWDLESLEKKGLLIIHDYSPNELKETTASEIIKMARARKVERLVIDSLSALAINTPTINVGPTDITDISIKRFLYRFVSELRDPKITSLLISQAPGGSFSRDGVSEFICDGIIHINYEPMGGKYNRNLTIRKMREVANDEDIHPLEISQKGVRVHNL